MFDGMGKAWLVGRKKHRILIDDDDLSFLDRYNVYVQCRSRFLKSDAKKVLVWQKGVSNERRRMIPLKKLIMRTRKGEEVIHLNDDPLDLRRENLKIIGKPLLKKKRLIKRW